MGCCVDFLGCEFCYCVACILCDLSGAYCDFGGIIGDFFLGGVCKL